jgi:hypothetical protein
MENSTVHHIHKCNSGLVEEDPNNSVPAAIRNHPNRALAKGKHTWLPGLGPVLDGFSKAPLQQHAAIGTQAAIGLTKRQRAAKARDAKAAAEAEEEWVVDEDEESFDNEEAAAEDYFLSPVSALVANTLTQSPRHTIEYPPVKEKSLLNTQKPLHLYVKLSKSLGQIKTGMVG